MAQMEINKDLVISDSNINLSVIANDSFYPEDANAVIIGTYRGKPLYRQRFSFALTGTYKENGKTFTWYNPNIPFGYIINIYGYAGMGNGYTYPINMGSELNTCIDNSKRIQVGLTTSLVVGQWVTVILEYTKSTD